MSEAFTRDNRRYNLNLITGCLISTVLLSIVFGAALILAMKADQQAARYPDATIVSSHSNYQGLPSQFRWDNAYRTTDNFTSVYNWYSTTFDLGAEARASENCIYLEGSRTHFVVKRQTSVFLCNTTGQQLIYVSRYTSFR